MNRIIAVLVFMLCAGIADAQTRRTLKDIDRELAQTKSTATVMELVSAIAEAEPQTEEDIRVLGELMDRYPREGQRALAKAHDPKLAKAVMKECERQINQVREDRSKDWKSLSETQRQKKINAIFNAYAMISALGNLKNKDAVPFLKRYITSEYDGEISYTASQAIGRIAPDDPVVFGDLWRKNDVKHINYGAYGTSVLKEVSQKLQSGAMSREEKAALRAKANVGLLNGSTSEEKQLLKDIVLNHPDEDLRMEAGQAMTKALMFHPSEGDVDFILKWTKNPKEKSGSQAMIFMRDHYNDRFAPAVINYLKNGDDYARSRAVELAGQHGIKEALPYIKECITKDRSSRIRGNCRVTYWEMTGEMSSDFTPEDAQRLENYLTNPRVLRAVSKIKDDDPAKAQYLAQKSALEKYKQIHR